MNSKRVSAWIFSLLFLVAWPFELPVAEETALGKTAFETRCVQCHDQAGPATKIAEDWWEKLNVADSGGQLSQQEQTEAISFLQHHDRKVTEMVVTAPERRLFEEKCNLCHIADRVILEPQTPVTRRHIDQRMQQREPDCDRPGRVRASGQSGRRSRTRSREFGPARTRSSSSSCARPTRTGST